MRKPAPAKKPETARRKTSRRPSSAEAPPPQNQPPPVKCRHDRIAHPAKLTPHPRNPNDHPAKQIDVYAHVLRSAGWRRPVVVSKLSGFVIRGHGAVVTAAREGWLVPVEEQDYESAEQELADMMADNQLARLSDMNFDRVRVLLGELEGTDLTATAFTQSELDALAAMTTVPGANTPINEQQLGQKTHKCPSCKFEW